MSARRSIVTVLTIVVLGCPLMCGSRTVVGQDELPGLAAPECDDCDCCRAANCPADPLKPKVPSGKDCVCRGAVMIAQARAADVVKPDLGWSYSTCASGLAGGNIQLRSAPAVASHRIGAHFPPLC